MAVTIMNDGTNGVLTDPVFLRAVADEFDERMERKLAPLRSTAQRFSIPSSQPPDIVVTPEFITNVELPDIADAIECQAAAIDRLAKAVEEQNAASLANAKAIEAQAKSLAALARAVSEQKPTKVDVPPIDVGCFTAALDRLAEMLKPKPEPKREKRKITVTRNPMGDIESMEG